MKKFMGQLLKFLLATLIVLAIFAVVTLFLVWLANRVLNAAV